MYFCIIQSLIKGRNNHLASNKNMKKVVFSLLSVLILLFTGCAHTSVGRLVGNDRDEHGCIGSAGYTWSYALHDCVRLWEVGTRFESGPEVVYLVYSTDSTFAEIFPEKGKSIICKRVKGTDTWTRRKGKESVSIKNGVTCVSVDNYNYTHTNE